jgi:hypothetical protein
MTLRSIKFERATRTLIRAEIRKTPRFNAQRRALPSIRRRSSETALLAFLFGLFTFGAALPWRENGIAVALASMSIPLTAFSLVYFNRYLLSIYNNQHIAVLTHLPFSDADIWRAQLKRARFPWLALLLTLLFLYGLLGSMFGINHWPLIILAIPQTLILLAAAIHLAAYPVPVPLTTVGIVILLGWTCGSFLFRSFLNLDAARPILLLLPPAWPHQLYLGATGQVHWNNYFWLAPILLFIAIVPRSIARIRLTFLWAVHHAFSAEGQAAQELAEPAPEKIPVTTSQGETAIGPTALIDATLSGDSLAPPQFHAHGWIEKLAARWFTPRETLIASFIWFTGVRWTARWKTCSLWFLAAVVTIIIFCTERWKIHAYLLGFCVGCCGLPIVRQARGLSIWQVGPGLYSSFYSGFPFAYNELLRTIAKANLIRSLAALPLWLVYGAIIGGILGNSILTGAEIALKTWTLMLLLQPIIIVRWLSDSISMTQKGSELILIIILLSIFLGLPALGATIAIRKFPIYWAIALSIAIISISILLLHRRLYRKNGLDCLGTIRV